MDCITKCVGLDVSKEKIAVAVAEHSGGPVRYRHEIPNTPEAVHRELGRIGNPEELRVCYEAGVTGYGLARHLRAWGMECVVAAPSKIERVPGPKVKTDRKDAEMLADKLRKNDLVPVWVPGEDDEALRDLIRARKARRGDLTKAKQRVAMCLMRHGFVKPQGMTAWAEPYRAWLNSLEFPHRAARAALQEYIIAVDEVAQSIRRLEGEIHEISTEGRHAPIIHALQALRGFREVAAATVVAEIGDFRRFATPTQLMSYAGLVPRESSSGSRVWRGGITKTGSSCLRWILTECAWAYRYNPKVSAAMAKRMQGLSGEVQAIALRAQNRLHHKYNKIVGSRGSKKEGCKAVAITAVARELLGFVWAIARQVDHETRSGEEWARSCHRYEMRRNPIAG